MDYFRFIRVLPWAFLLLFMVGCSDVEDPWAFHYKSHCSADNKVIVRPGTRGIRIKDPNPVARRFQLLAGNPINMGYLQSSFAGDVIRCEISIPRNGGFVDVDCTSLTWAPAASYAKNVIESWVFSSEKYGLLELTISLNNSTVRADTTGLKSNGVAAVNGTLFITH